MLAKKFSSPHNKPVVLKPVCRSFELELLESFHNGVTTRDMCHNVANGKILNLEGEELIKLKSI